MQAIFLLISVNSVYQHLSRLLSFKLKNLRWKLYSLLYILRNARPKQTWWSRREFIISSKWSIPDKFSAISSWRKHRWNPSTWGKPTSQWTLFLHELRCLCKDYVLCESWLALAGWNKSVAVTAFYLIFWWVRYKRKETNEGHTWKMQRRDRGCQISSKPSNITLSSSNPLEHLKQNSSVSASILHNNSTSHFFTSQFWSYSSLLSKCIKTIII